MWRAGRGALCRVPREQAWLEGPYGAQMPQQLKPVLPGEPRPWEGGQGGALTQCLGSRLLGPAAPGPAAFCGER